MNAFNDNLESMPLDMRAQLERRLLEARRAAAGAPSAVQAAPPANNPLSFAQQRFWFLDQYEENSSVYNVSRSFRLKGQVDAAALENALAAVVARHESLRTTFVTIDGEPVQRIGPPGAFRLTIVDLASLPPDDRERQLDRMLLEESRRPFRLSEDLMLRAVLYRLGPGDQALILATHHAASDAWSMEILLRELSESYAALQQGVGPALGPLPMQFAQFAREQRKLLHSPEWKRDLEYWKRQLEGIPSLLRLPADHPRPARETFRGSRMTRRLPRPLASALARLARDSGSTLFMTLLCAFKTLLARYTGEEDIFVGSPVAGRSRLESEAMIGLFVNTVVLRTDLGGDPTFREALQRVRDVALEAFSHQEFPFEKLVEELQPQRELSHSPLYQVMFALQNTTQAVLNLPGVVVMPISLDPGTSKLDLTWEMTEYPDRLELRVEYNVDLFREATIARMADHFAVLLEGIVADPDQPISRLPLLTAAERRLILETWSRPDEPDRSMADARPRPAPRTACFHQAFEEHAASNPDRAAVVFHDETLTYGQLNEQANRLAHYLQSLGVGPDRRVAICLDRSPRMLAALLAVAKAGGAYVPLDPDWPSARLQLLMQDIQAPVVLTEEQLLPAFGDSAARFICLDRDAALFERESSENPVSDVAPDHLVYVIYTSGSTGLPKGVLVPHRGLMNFLSAACVAPGMNANDAILASIRLSFDAAAIELLLPLVAGARIVLADKDAARDGFQLLELIRRHGVNTLLAIPSGWEMLLQAGTLPAGIKALSGGEVLSPKLAAAICAQSRELWNMYGPTEVSICSTMEKVDPEGAITIGRPIPGAEAYVLDRCGQPVPAGLPGELYLGGVGLARGYWNRAELTDERFVPHPFRDDPRARLYRTGDLVRWRDDGRLEYLGRVDQQVKVRGFRIELTEIESVLAGHPQIEECAVLAHKADAAGAQLVAYFTPRTGETIETAHLRRWLGRQLPDYSLPARFVRMTSLPRLPNGKIDRKALPERSAEQPSRTRPETTDANPIEQVILRIWTEVLGRDDIGLRDNFFELGGHSLLAMRVATRLQDRLQVDVTVRTVFEAPTIAALAHAVGALAGRQAGNANG